MWQRIFSRPPSLRRILTIRVSLLLLVTLVVITLLAFWNGRATVADLGGRIVRRPTLGGASCGRPPNRWTTV